MHYSEGRLGSAFHSQAGASNAVDDPGGSVDDPLRLGPPGVLEWDALCAPTTKTMGVKEL